MRRAVAPVVILAAFFAVACHPKQVSGPATRVKLTSTPDSAVGVVSVVGTAFDKAVALRVGETVIQLGLTDADIGSMGRMGGVQVVVRGIRSGANFSVVSFTARSVEGQPVIDGTIRVEGHDVLLDTSNGRIPLGNPPAALRSLAGTRIWLSGPPETGPNSYGIITPVR